MAQRPPIFRLHGAPRTERQYDQDRRANKPGRAWYSLRLWRDQLQPQQLQRQPLCELHLERGEIVAANTVNHRTPHKGDWSLFVDPYNHQSVCASCHSSDVQRQERQPLPTLNT